MTSRPPEPAAGLIGRRSWTVPTWDNGRPATATLGPAFDAAAVHAYTHGQCHAFAVATHELTGWPLAAIAPSQHPDEPAHIVCTPSPQVVYDADGWQPFTPALWHTYDQLVDASAVLVAARLEHLPSGQWHPPAMDAARWHARLALHVLRVRQAA